MSVVSLPSDKSAEHQTLANLVRQHMRSEDGERALTAEVNHQLQRIADAVA